MLRDHCYYSLDYSDDIRRIAKPQAMVQMDRVIQYPFTAPGTYETSEEMAARMAEKKREQGRRLQAQAAAQRTQKVGHIPSRAESAKLGSVGGSANAYSPHEQLLQREQDVATYLAVKELKSQEKKADYMVTSLLLPPAVTCSLREADDGPFVV